MKPEQIDPARLEDGVVGLRTLVPIVGAAIVAAVAWVRNISRVAGHGRALRNVAEEQKTDRALNAREHESIREDLREIREALRECHNRPPMGQKEPSP